MAANIPLLFKNKKKMSIKKLGATSRTQKDRKRQIYQNDESVFLAFLKLILLLFQFWNIIIHKECDHKCWHI